MPETADQLGLVGTQLLGRYTVSQRLASGGMSEVYRGYDERLHRGVCIKVFCNLDPSRPEYQTAYDYFLQESQALSTLQHPNTVRIYDFGHLGRDPFNPFFVSEVLEGGTLNDLITESGPLSLAKALELLEPVAGALAEAHFRGIIHRDIKPSNILFGVVGSRRVVKLVDFGIAQATGPDGCPSFMGQPLALYSPGWATPEQLRCEPVNPTTDVYALGLIAAFMVSGMKVFPNNGLPRLPAETSEEEDALTAEAIRQLPLPSGLAEVVAVACRARCEDRFQSMDELLSALLALVGRKGSSGLKTPPGSNTDAFFPRIHTPTVELTSSQSSSVATEPPALNPSEAPVPSYPGPRATNEGSLRAGLAAAVLSARASGGFPRVALGGSQGGGALSSVPPVPVSGLHPGIQQSAWPADTSRRASGVHPGVKAGSEPVRRTSGIHPVVEQGPWQTEPTRRASGLHSIGALDREEPARGEQGRLFVAQPEMEEFIAGGRRVRLLRAEDRVDVEARREGAAEGVRLRVTLPAELQGMEAARLHLKGLNCFLARPGGRVTGGLDVEDHARIQVLEPNRTRAADLSCAFARADAEHQLVPLGPHTVALPLSRTRFAVLLDFGPDREAVLVYRARRQAVPSKGQTS